MIYPLIDNELRFIMILKEQFLKFFNSFQSNNLINHKGLRTILYIFACYNHLLLLLVLNII